MKSSIWQWTITVAADLCAVAATGQLGHRLPVPARLGLRAAVATSAGAIIVDHDMTALVLTLCQRGQRSAASGCAGRAPCAAG